MTKEKKKRLPDVLCPFFERECPMGEETARRCCRRMNCGNEALVDDDDYTVDCFIADWMFSVGDRPFY